MRRSPADEVRDLLDRYPPACRPVDEPEAMGGAGGLSGSRLWRFRSGQGPLVLRLWPPHGPGRAHLERVHGWLIAAGDLGFIPVPVADRSGRTLQDAAGGLWELAPWMPGAPDDARPPSSGRVGAAMAAMAAFHARLGGERRIGVSPGLAHRHAAVVHLIGGGLDGLERAIRRAADDSAPSALRWAALARAVAPGLVGPLRDAASRPSPLQPCLRDARPEHFLFDGDRVTGLVDFGAMDVDGVAGDIARLLGEWNEDDPAARAEALAAYERVRPLDAGEAALIDAFAAAADLLVGDRWIRWHYVEGRRFDDPSAAARGIARGLAHLERRARST